MASSSEDVLFERFRESGDPDALAAVFDLTAPELLRVACHLVGQRASAEDVVQETFLAAIDHAVRFDPARAVLPWLLGILANLARRHRRDARRNIAPDRLQKSSPADPREDAEAEEFGRALDQALAELPDAYREPMILHVRHGLSAREIAQAMGRPAGTIRTYLVRGMDYLRKGLPAGFAAGAAALATPTRGIAAVRAAVLSHARPLAAAAAPLAVVSLFGGMFAMKKMLFAGVVVALVAAGSLVFHFATPEQGSGTSEGEASPIAAADRAERPPLRSTDSAPVATERAIVPAEGKSTAPGSLLVRVIHAADQTAAAGVGVVVTRELYTPWDHKGFFGEARTGEDGTVVLEDLPPGKVWARTDRGPCVQAAVRSGERGEALVQLTEAMTLTGSVLDHEGTPRPAARILYFDQDSNRQLGRLLGHTGPDGRFRFRGIESSLTIWAEVAGQKPSAIQQASRDGTRMVEVTLVVGPAGQRLEGRVVDPSGAPVAHAPVAVAIAKPGLEAQGFKGYRHDPFNAYPLRADAEGRFAVDWAPQGEVLLFARDPEVIPKRRKMLRFTVKPDTVNRVELRLSDLPAVHGTLRDSLGEPIAGEHVSAFWRQYSLSAGGAFFTDHGWAVSAEDGSFRIPGLLTGGYSLNTSIQNNSLNQTVDLVEGQDLLWNPVLDRGQPAQVRVVDEAGAPCKGWRVDWRQWETPSWNRNHKVLSHPVSETTGDDGRAAFTGLKTGTYVLLLHSPLPFRRSHLQEFDPFPALVHEGARPGSAEIEVRVPKNQMPSVTLKGRVLGPEGEPLADARVGWSRTDWKSGFTSFDFPVDRATGGFELGPLSPGSYVVGAKCEGFVGGGLPMREALPDRVLDVGDLRLRTPAFLEVTLRAAGATDLKDTRLLLGAASVEAPKVYYLNRVEGSRYRSIPLPPATYVLIACAEGLVPARREVTVVSGQEERIEIDLEPGLPCTIELVFPPGPSGNPSGVLRVQGAGGAVVFEEGLWGYFDDLEKRIVRRRLALIPGRYVLEADGFADTKVRGGITFDVPAGGLREPISVPLR